MEQRELTWRAFGPRYSTGTDAGREIEEREGHFQLGKGGRARERTSPSCFSPQRSLREAKRLSERPAPSRDLRWPTAPSPARSPPFGCFSGGFVLLFRSHHPAPGWCVHSTVETSRLIEVTSSSKCFLEADEAHSKLWLKSQSSKQTPQGHFSCALPARKPALAPEVTNFLSGYNKTVTWVTKLLPEVTIFLSPFRF